MRNSGWALAVGLTAVLATLAACNKPAEAPQTASAAAGFVPVPQGWTAKQKADFYTLPQGSRLIPYAWARQLELAGSTAMFMDPAHLQQKLGYVVAPDAPAGALPIGFTLDATPEARLTTTAMHWTTRQDQPGAKLEPWLGLNCSACHTAKITYAGKSMIVDGGPALTDFQTLLADLRASLNATRRETDPEKFKRFADRVLTGADNTPANRDKLAAALTAVAKHEDALAAINQTDSQYGHGRLDAFGHIYSKVAYLAAGEDAVAQPSDAPTSYPYIWGIPYQDLIQYNGIAKNFPVGGVHRSDPGALARNIGEVVGVFADAKLTDHGAQGARGYRSSVNIENLIWFEQELDDLRAPPWPGEAVFGDKGKLNPTLVAQGRKLFGTDNTDPNRITCATCHQVVAPDRQTQRVKIRMSSLVGPDAPGTDATMACNAALRSGPSGVLKGTKKGVFLGPPLGEEPPISDLLITTAAGIILDQKGAVLATTAASAFGVNQPVPGPQVNASAKLSAHDAFLQTCLAVKRDLVAYKARPLNGIWATAPYLHNGSVPTLAEVLDPAHRSPTFWVGGREYDPEHLGYVSTPNVGSKFDTSLPGNSNQGHDYGTSAMSPDQRRALLEYLKTL